MQIYLEPIKENEFNDFYLLRCEQQNIYWTNNIVAPIKESFLNWCSQQLLREDREIYLVRLNDISNIIGYVYLDILGEKKDQIEIGYAISESIMGKGIGTKVIEKLTKHCNIHHNEVKKLGAWVLENNIRSVRCITKNNWRETEKYKSIFFEPTKEMKIMKFYEYVK